MTNLADRRMGGRNTLSAVRSLVGAYPWVAPAGMPGLQATGG